MKTLLSNRRKLKRGVKRIPAKGGFAIIVTVSILVLLAVIAVGLLTLSTVTVRSAQQGNAMQLARANAKLALMLAIGDLQKKMGPDQRISAPASLVDVDAPFGVTGAWTASTTDRLGKDYGEKEQQFLGWLASDSINGVTPSTATLPTQNPDGAGNALLLGEGSLGSRQSMKGDDARIAAKKLEITTGNVRGNFAWMTFDESVKSRMDMHDDRRFEEPVASMARVGSPGRDGMNVLEALETFLPDGSQSERMLSMQTAVLATGVEELPAYQPDLTTWSVSLQTDTVRGGLKKDLSTLFSRDLTTAEQDWKLYETAGLTTGVSDPPMSLLAGYHELYKKIGTVQGRVRPGKGEMAAHLPSKYRPTVGRTGTPNRKPPPEPVMAPSILRVDMIFSMVTRDVHGGRASRLTAAGYPYMLHLMYLPVVTVHNPYDVPLIFDSMKVTFKDIPIGFQYLINRQPVTTDLVPLNNHFVSHENGGNSKEFGITLQSANGSGNQKLRMEPGQTKLFGTPKVPPSWTWAQESPGSGRDGIHLFDWRSNQTSEFSLAPTLITQSTTTACGFDVDWLQPRAMQTANGRRYAHGEGIIALRGNETIGVNFGPVAQPSNSFSVNLELAVSGRGTSSGVISMDYGDVGRLKEIVEEGTSMRYPDARTFPAVFPEPAVDGVIRVRDIYEPNGRQVKDYVSAKPFAIFSLSGKTTRESFVPSRPFADGSPVMHLASIDLAANKDVPGDQPFELVMMPIRNNTSVIEEIRATQEGYFFGGHGALRGTPRATFYEVPRMPLQSLAQLRHANLASSGIAPFTTYTVGESRAHPMLPSDRVESPSPADGEQMLDHTWLSNSALWDSYFLSSIADYTGESFAQEKAVNQVRAGFFSGSDQLLNSRMVVLGHSSESERIATELATDTGWLKVAEYVGVKGGFNVNSTSVDAWRSILSGLRDEQIMTAEGMENNEKLTPFPRVRLPAKKGIEGSALLLRDLKWQGFRRLSDAEIEGLAEQIVVEIRERGPFLSMSEFVNRRLGPSNDEKSLRGALEAALVKAGVNDIMADEGLELDAGSIGPHGYPTPEAAYGSSAVGAPGVLSQGDLLSALGSHLTVRGDTYVIRSYGEATSATNEVLARAWCEAVVQRLPEYVDPGDDAAADVADLDTVNSRFGRRFRVVSFRWLAEQEV